MVNGRHGLLLNRDETVEVQSISGISLAMAEINSISTEYEGFKLFCRTKQEIFIAEGIRFVDLGIKFEIAEYEIFQNSKVSGGDLLPVAVFPPV